MKPCKVTFSQLQEDSGKTGLQGGVLIAGAVVTEVVEKLHDGMAPWEDEQEQGVNRQIGAASAVVQTLYWSAW